MNMRRTIVTIAMWIAMGLAALAADPVVDFSKDDPKMNAAIAKARGGLSTVFPRVFDASGNAHPAFSLKVAVPIAGSDDGNEIIWVNSIRKRGKAFSGKLANAPVLFKGDVGDPLKFNESQIADWGLSAPNGKLFGHYTTRAMLPRLPSDQAAQIKSILSKRPMPDGF